MLSDSSWSLVRTVNGTLHVALIDPYGAPARGDRQNVLCGRIVRVAEDGGPLIGPMPDGYVAATSVPLDRDVLVTHADCASCRATGQEFL